MEKETFRLRVRLRHIHCFLAVAEQGNLGKAAERLRLTQPAVSKTLSELEDIAHCKLFERNRQGARLTSAGEQFRRHALGVLEALDAVGNAIGLESQQENACVRLGVLPSVGVDLVPAALAVFRKLHPHAQVSVETGANAALVDMLKAGSVDCVMGRMADPQMLLGLSFELLYVEPLCLVARPGHPMTATALPRLEDVLAYPLLVSPKGTIPRHNAESFLRSRGFAMPLQYTETQSVSIAREIVLQSDAIWIAPLGAARHAITSGMLARLAVPTEGSEEPVGLLQRSDASLGAAVRDFMTVLRDVASARRPPQLL
ncbi:LysR substrate-binding domain-containing protein [Noviherbaspirillum saxi]|uniref:LysR family transcriptional regulator n=1 Tax=Noviherbaspirillum saxi TaxID=2320863 RepID=A0A3A3G4I3_9BURK|nr:LysR substrate-binding domain-containing protein [Noviherbaspirillum saxi]RJF95100.1 LysR family transcriptional regulator [Noviherbaspirillum saxi]